MRLIDAEALYNEVDSWGCNDYDKYDFLEAIENAPTVTDRSLDIAQKSIELGRSLGRTEERVESKTSHGKWIKIFENPFVNGYICPFCGHKIQVTEQFLPEVTECEVCGADMRGEE